MNRKALTKAMELQGVPKDQIEKVSAIKGSIKDWSDAKILLDEGTTLEEIDKQCIINRCYKLTRLSLLF